MVWALSILAVLLQVTALGFAIWMAATTRRRLAWILFAAGFLGMAYHRIFSLAVMVVHPERTEFSDALRLCLIAACLLAAMVYLRVVYRERDASQGKLRASEERYRSVVKAVGEGIIISSEEGVLACNPAACRILGLKESEILGKHRAEVLPDAIRLDGTSVPLEERPTSITLRTGEACRNTLLGIRRGDGKRAWLSFNSEPMRDGDENLVVLSFMDVTDRIAAEAELLAAKNAAEHANAAKDQFLAVLSHELRTPLTPVLATIDLMSRERGLPETAQADLEMLRRNVELEARLIDDLLDLTRITKGKLQIGISPVDLHQIIRQVLEICASDVDAKKLRLELRLEAEKCAVPGDSARLQQILWNLLKNAFKFTPEGGRITITTSTRIRRACGAMIIVEVTDTGVGIEPGALPLLFNAFEQGGKQVTRRFGGLGLGLAITKALVELHRGSVRAQSAGPGQGATFTVELPLIVRPEIPDPPPAWHGHDGRSLSILLLEDHEDTSRAVARLLMVLGHRVKTAGKVRDGVVLANRESFDLVLSDIGLPDGTGLDFVRELRKTKKTPAIAVSGYGMEEDVARSKEAGFTTHVTKPITIDGLEKAIEEAMGGEGA